MAVREALGISPDQLMILTVGGDAASKGAQEVMQALAIIDTKAPIGQMSAKYGLSREPSFKTWPIWKWRQTWALKKMSLMKPTPSHAISCLTWLGHAIYMQPLPGLRDSECRKWKQEHAENRL